MKEDQWDISLFLDQIKILKFKGCMDNIYMQTSNF